LHACTPGHQLLGGTLLLLLLAHVQKACPSMICCCCWRAAVDSAPAASSQPLEACAHSYRLLATHTHTNRLCGGLLLQQRLL
jgi:hypothetical protein